MPHTGPILEGVGSTDYERYIRTVELLSLQKDVHELANPDERLFQITHQAAELWLKEIDYEVDPARGDKFYAAVRRYWPGLKDGALQPDYSGIRPKIVPPGAPAQDFTFHGPETHRIPGLIHLFGIESPGLTATLAIGDHVLAMTRA